MRLLNMRKNMANAKTKNFSEPPIAKNLNVQGQLLSQVSGLRVNSLWLLLSSQLLNLTMISDQLSIWMLAIIGLCLCWRALMNVQETAKPSKGVLVLLALSGSVLLAVMGKQLGLLNSMVHLLCFAYGLKSLELNTRKDIYQLSLLGIFVLASALIFSQSIYFSLIVFLFVVVNFVLLNSLFMVEQTTLKQVKTTGVLFLQSLPLAIVLFIVFPKLPPFWKVPLAKSSTTGLSDSVQIGDIANLVGSDALAYRVDFGDFSPAYRQLYWRTLVLDHFDGVKWTTSHYFSTELTEHQANINANQQVNHQRLRQNSPSNIIRRNPAADVIKVTDEVINYQIIAEPSYQHWLFALDVAKVNEGQKIIQTPYYNLYAVQEVTKTLQYSVTSNLSMALDLNLSKLGRETNLAIPEQSNPRLTAEGRRLRAQYKTDEAIISAVLEHFRQQNYFYTLQPPLLINNSLEQFYFETRAGFCEYYASTFAYLMRAAGIPTRLVLGYMGGELNPNGRYYSIYQRDAHAWTEVWLAGKGWQRVDPTAAVHPSRVESGFNDSLLAEQASLSNSLFSAQTFENLAFLNNIRMQLQALDYQWTRWVVGYSSEKQLNLLSQWLGKVKPWKMALIIGVILVSMMLVLWLAHFINNKEKTRVLKSHQQLYQTALNILRAKGYCRTSDESAKQFVERVMQELQALPKSHAGLINCFLKLSQAFETLEYQTLTAAEKSLMNANMKKLYKRFKSHSKHL